jgi:hypothetical protein
LSWKSTSAFARAWPICVYIWPSWIAVFPFGSNCCMSEAIWFCTRVYVESRVFSSSAYWSPANAISCWFEAPRRASSCRRAALFAFCASMSRSIS